MSNKPKTKKGSHASRPNKHKSNQTNTLKPESNLSENFLYGLHTVEAALRNPNREIIRLQATPNAASKLEQILSVNKIPPEKVDPKDLDKLLGPDIVHQGVLLEAKPLPLIEIEDLSACSPLLILDQVTDPHNVGAILRSAAAFGVGALMMTQRNSPPLSGSLAKIASGGLEYVPICLVSNLSRALEELAKQGFWLIGLDSEGDECLEDIELKGPISLVLGAEGKGLRRLTREKCHQIAKIKTASNLASLNVSNAAAIALHSLHINNSTKKS